MLFLNAILLISLRIYLGFKLSRLIKFDLTHQYKMLDVYRLQKKFYKISKIVSFRVALSAKI